MQREEDECKNANQNHSSTIDQSVDGFLKTAKKTEQLPPIADHNVENHLDLLDVPKQIGEEKEQDGVEDDELDEEEQRAEDGLEDGEDAIESCISSQRQQQVPIIKGVGQGLKVPGRPTQPIQVLKSSSNKKVLLDNITKFFKSSVKNQMQNQYAEKEKQKLKLLRKTSAKRIMDNSGKTTPVLMTGASQIRRKSTLDEDHKMEIQALQKKTYEMKHLVLPPIVTMQQHSAQCNNQNSYTKKSNSQNNGGSVQPSSMNDSLESSQRSNSVNVQNKTLKNQPEEESIKAKQVKATTNRFQSTSESNGKKNPITSLFKNL